MGYKENTSFISTAVQNKLSNYKLLYSIGLLSIFFLDNPMDWLFPDSAGLVTFLPLPPLNDHLMAQRMGCEVPY